MKGGVVLNSDSYSSQLIRTFSDLYKNNLLTDVTIVCDDRFRIECHRMVLCASSPLLGDFITITGQRQEDAMKLEEDTSCTDIRTSSFH